MIREQDKLEPRVPILMYHYLGKSAGREDVPYFVSSRRFKAQLKLLALEKYRPVDLHELLNLLAGQGALPGKPIVITFDDGHRSFCSTAVPLLKSYRFKATMFLITRRIGTEGYLSWPEIEGLNDNIEFSFQSHGTNHAILTKLSGEEAWVEIATSKELLESKLEGSVYAYAYRGGHYNDEIAKMVERAGYGCAVSSKAGLVDRSSNRFALARIGIRGSDSLYTFYKKLRLGSRVTTYSLFKILYASL